jgi:Lon protease-like protein
MMVQADFPLFPLGMVALPYEAVPLHIFEPRYRTMVSECVETGSEFGIVWAAEDGVRQIGCACEVSEVLERHEDGRMDILGRGTRPFRLVDSHDNLPYPAGTVEWLTDKDEQPDQETVVAAHEAYASLLVEATDLEPEPERVDAMSAYAMAATVDFGLEAKQGLLGLRSENARLRLVTRLLRAALKRLDFIERAQARARSNGKVRFD